MTDWGWTATFWHIRTLFIFQNGWLLYPACVRTSCSGFSVHCPRKLNSCFCDSAARHKTAGVNKGIGCNSRRNRRCKRRGSYSLTKVSHWKTGKAEYGSRGEDWTVFHPQMRKSEDLQKVVRFLSETALFLGILDRNNQTDVCFVAVFLCCLKHIR